MQVWLNTDSIYVTVTLLEPVEEAYMEILLALQFVTEISCRKFDDKTYNTAEGSRRTFEGAYTAINETFCCNWEKKAGAFK